MSRNLARSAPAPRRRSRWALAVALTLALGGLGLAALAIETRPRVATTGALDAAVAADARAAGDVLRDFVDTGGAAGRVRLSVTQINALLASGGRLTPGVGSAAELLPDGVGIEVSVGAPHLPAGLWANLGLVVTADAGGASIVAARLGRLPLPAAPVQRLLTWGADRVLGAGLTEQARTAVVGLRIEGETVEAEFDLAPAARADLLARLRALLNGAAGGPVRDPIYTQLYWLDRLGDEGRLPRRGTLTPYLAQMIRGSERVAQRFSDVADRDHAAAALLALALYCGEPALGAAIGVSLKDRMRGSRNHCEGVTLAGRDDLKRHFAVSAGLFAASSGAAALGVGELKELIDSGAGGSGFSFDDMAANLAGARFAAAFLAAPRADWPAMAARIGSEADLMPDVADLPRGLEDRAFRDRFGDIDSQRYRDLLAEIGRRIDALPFHRALDANPSAP